jgi:hypothetical protein
MGFTGNDVTKANGIYEVSDGLSRKVLDVDICVGYSGYLVSWEVHTFQERLSHNRIKHGSTTVDPYKKWSKKIYFGD